MNVRTFQRGDEAAQVAIYNEAAGLLPKFKPATSHEVQRRTSARDFDPSTRFYALEKGEPVGYASFSTNGRVSFPWCRKGHEHLAEPLFQHMLQAMKQRGLSKAFAAYRGDWAPVLDFFGKQSFKVAREMVNYVIDIFDMPTAPARRTSNVTPLERKDIPTVFALAPHVLRCTTPQELERHLFDNPYFPGTSVFCLRSQRDGSVLGAGVFISNSAYANPKAVDSAMPCFRLGAFGTEGMTTKRINGLLSFLCRDDSQCGSIAVDLMGHAVNLVEDDDDIVALAGQVPSDAPNLSRFYHLNFRKQGSFPVLERALA